MTGNHVIAERLRKPAASRMCQECTIMVADSIHHTCMLFERESASHIRSPLWRCVISECPQALAVEMSNLNNSDRCMFLLSGFHSPNIIREWDMVYVNICKFIIAIYDHKVSLILS